MSKNGILKRIFLIDGDNNPYTALNGADLLTAEDTVLFYYSPGCNLSRIRQRLRNVPADIQFVESVRTGKNSLDFQIIMELGVLAGQRKIDCAYIISQDQGYEAAIHVLKIRYASIFQEVERKESIEDCFPLNFLIKAADKQELYVTLVREYGNAHGSFLYHHLNKIFRPSPVSLPADQPEADTVEEDKPETLDNRCKIWL